MNHTYGWMNGGMGGGIWVWTVIVVVVVYSGPQNSDQAIS